MSIISFRFQTIFSLLFNSTNYSAGQQSSSRQTFRASMYDDDVFVNNSNNYNHANSRNGTNYAPIQKSSSSRASYYQDENNNKKPPVPPPLPPPTPPASRTSTMKSIKSENNFSRQMSQACKLTLEWRFCSTLKNCMSQHNYVNLISSHSHFSQQTSLQ